MQVGDAVEMSPSIKRWAAATSLSGRESGIIVGIIYHEILNAKVYEVMWDDSRIRRQYSSDIRAIPHNL